MDVGFTISAIFAIFLALYIVVTVLLSSMLLNTLKLPVSYFTTARPSTTYREKLDQVYTQALEEDLMVVFWLWWGHYHAPLNVIFLLATFSAVSMSVSTPSCSSRVRLLCSEGELTAVILMTDDQIGCGIVEISRATVGRVRNSFCNVLALRRHSSFLYKRILTLSVASM